MSILSATSFFLSRRTTKADIALEDATLAGEAVHLAGRAPEDATAYFQIPPDRVVEIGTQIAV